MTLAEFKRELKSEIFWLELVLKNSDGKTHKNKISFSEITEEEAKARKEILDMQRNILQYVLEKARKIRVKK